jgi:hypothetical protein
MRRSTTINASRLLIVEGVTDEMVFAQVIKKHSLDNLQPLHGRSANQESSGGWATYGEFLLSLEVPESFKQVELIIAVGDNDDDQSFANICDQLELAGYTRPSAPRTIVSTAGKPDAGILMLPESPGGCIESICYEAACEKWPNLRPHLDAYIAQTPAQAWTQTKLAKMRVECTLAATCEKMPEVALKDHWQKGEKYSIPVDGPAFADVVSYLKSLPA